MNKQITSVFYDANLLPFKDSARTIHYPLVSGTFAGSHNTKEVRFYVRDIGGTNGISWVVVSKLPNGKIGYEVCSNVVYDSELGEQYLSFDLSAYYTQVKGDLYLALRGYQGQITFEDDDNDGVYSIEGEPLIEVTGTIKLSINYSPMVNTGTQVLPTDIDKLLAALSDYLLMENGFAIISDLNVDLTGYANGQYFYVESQKAFYQLISGTLTKVEIALPFDVLSTQTAEQLYQLYGNKPFTLQRYGGFLVCKISYNTMNYLYDFVVYEYAMQDYNEILGYQFGTNTGTDTFESLYSGATPVVTYATQEWVASNYVDLANTQTITGKKIFNDLNLYNSVITTNSKNYFARAGVTTNQFVTYQLPFSYSEIGNTTVTLAIENLVGLQGTQQGTLPAGNLAKVQKDNAIVKRSNKYYYKITSPTGQLVFSHIEVSQVDNVYTIKDERITVTISNGHWEYTSTSYNAYTKDGVDTLIASLKANTLQLVDITEYPTLNSFLASTGEEGIIYLYPIDTSESPQFQSGYYRYTWEDNYWLSLGTTQIDLSNYVDLTSSQTIIGVKTFANLPQSSSVPSNNYDLTTKEYVDNSLSNYVPTSRTIASIDLSANISASDLTDALAYATNTDIDNLF